MHPHPDSRLEKLSRLNVGGYLYEETTVENYPVVQRQYTYWRRFPMSMRSMRAETRVYTAVGTTAGDIRYLVRVERTQ